MKPRLERGATPSWWQTNWCPGAAQAQRGVRSNTTDRGKDGSSARALASVLLPLIASLGFGCSRDADASSAVRPTTARPVVSSTGSEVPSKRERSDDSTKTSLTTQAPSTLLELGETPYGATLGVDEHASYLLTPAAAYALLPDQAAHRWALDLGVSPALTRDRFVYWSGGSLLQVYKAGSDPDVLATVPHRPQRIVGSREHFAWLDQAEDGHFTINALDGSDPRVLYSPTGYIPTLAMDDSQIYFVEQTQEKGWRLGALPRAGGSAHFGAWAGGRTPSMLAVAEDLFYYDGPSSTVRRVSPDLERKDVIAREVICSPIAVAEHLYCAQPAGILEIGFDGAVRRAFPLAQQGTVTAISATKARLTWLMDVGRNQLRVQTIPLTPDE